MDTNTVLAALARGLDELGVDDALATLTGDPTVTFTDLGVDSLGVIELATIVESDFGVNIDDHLNEIEAPADIVALILQPAGV